MNYKWNYEEPTPEQNAAAAKLSEEIGVSQTLCLLLVKRGISTADEARAYFRPQLQALHDPFLMRDMDLAVNRLNQAMGNREKVMIYGDYDVDGCTAVALCIASCNNSILNSTTTFPTDTRRGMGCRFKVWTTPTRRV